MTFELMTLEESAKRVRDMAPSMDADIAREFCQALAALGVIKLTDFHPRGQASSADKPT